MIPGIIIIDSGIPGPTVGVMAVTHGDEPAGITAHNFLEEFFRENSLTKGKIILITGNIEAAKLGKICIDENMNRLFQDDSKLTEKQKNSQDYKRSRELMPVLASLDYLLDIHSTSSPSTVFSIIKTDTFSHRDIARHLPVEFSSSGWTGYIDGTTCDYADSQGCISATIECGNHSNPRGGEIAIIAVKMFLQKIGVHDFGVIPSKIEKHMYVVGHESISDKDTFNYTRIYNNFDTLASGECIAKDAVREYFAPKNSHSVIIFPTKIEHIRNGHCKEAYLIGTFHENSK